MKKQQNNGGFSLLEVILAMAILAILSIPLLSYFTQSMKYNAMTADKQHVTNLAPGSGGELKKTAATGGACVSRGIYRAVSDRLCADGIYPCSCGRKYDRRRSILLRCGRCDWTKYDVEVIVSTDVPENTALMPQMDGIDDTKDVVAAEGGQLQEALTYFSAENAQYAGANNVPAQSESEIEKI